MIREEILHSVSRRGRPKTLAISNSDEIGIEFTVNTEVTQLGVLSHDIIPVAMEIGQ